MNRILIDLKVALNNGYCGIANENRLLYKMLAEIPSLETNGLLISDNPATVFTNYQPAQDRDHSLGQANQFFHEALQHEMLFKNKILSKLKLTNLYALKKKTFSLYDIDPVFHEVIWRNVFDKTLSASSKDLILQKQFYYSDMSSMHLRANSYINRNAKLDTTNFDMAIFLEPTTVTVSPNTKKIVRYHDAIPLTEPDFASSVFSYRNANILNRCAQDSYFICNSEPTRQALLTLKPELEKKSFTIPACISSNYQKTKNVNILKKIIANRLSNQLIRADKLLSLQQQILHERDINYIFHLATLDPKKNQINLIRAWEKLNYEFDDNVKLIISANRGWLSQEIEEAMRPHIERGNIIHIDAVTSDEMPYLFSHARAFVFPSYIEGFGLPPIEAMQCECPTIVSDIATHRWVMGDASLFCNPYDIESIKDAMVQLIYSNDAQTLVSTLKRKGLEQVKKYSEETLRAQWQSIIANIA